jgi:hypothetical protein
MDALLESPSLSPRGEVQGLVERAINGEAGIGREAIAAAQANPDDSSLYVDELARLPLADTRLLTQASPVVLAHTAEVMLHHLDSMDWGRRDFNYANTPLRWAFEVLRVLVADGQAGRAEDLAVRFFEMDKQWNRFVQKPITLNWLRSLQETEGVAIARAICRSGTRDYYDDGMADGQIRSPTLAAEFGL